MNKDFAARCIGVFLGILCERYSDNEIIGMLQRDRLKKMLAVVRK